MLVLTGKEKISVELWIDSDGKAHSQIHTNSNASFKDTKVALIAFIKQLQWQLDNEIKCPFLDRS